MDQTTDPKADAPDGAGRARINPKSPREAIAPEPAPAPPRSRSVRNPLVVALNALITLMMLGILFAGGILYYGKAQFDGPGPLQQEKAILVPSESGLNTIATSLEQEGVISDRYTFMGGVWAYRQSRRLKAGEYAFAPGMSMREVMDLLVSGKAIMHSITLPEGLTSKQIVDRLRADELLIGDIAQVPPEGSLLPETYRYTRGTTRQQILDQMAAAHEKALAAVWETRRPDIPVNTPEELVTLASIVEKETGKADERPRVAAVFVNRLNRGMRLQSDPTVIYGVVGGEGTLGRAIRRSDLDAENAYNTYKINGLPPGPIANPGRAALEAVATPSSTDELYFVADGTGGHVFAPTLDQHNDNVAAWRQIERQRAQSGQQAADEREPDAIDAPQAGAGEASAAETSSQAASGDPLDLLDGQAPRDPDTPVLPVPKPPV